MSEVRWGFVGAGWIATKALAPAVHAAAGAQLYAAAARDVDRALTLRPHGRAYGSYDELIADPDVDAVYISLANDAHCRWAVQALAAGKHVLCEKPLALDAAEVDAMASAAAAADRLLVEASWYRWHPRIRLAQRLIADGAIGRVQHVSAGFTFAGVAAGNYRLVPAMGGGALYDVGCYAVSAVQWAFGGASPRSVTAHHDAGPTGVDLATEAVLQFDGGDASVRAGIAEPPRQWLVIEGDDGRIELADAAFTAWLGQDSDLLVTTGLGTERMAVPATDAYRTMVEQVSSVIRGDGGWVLPVEESRATAAILDACFASARAGGAPVEPAC